MKIGKIFLSDISREINPVIKVAEREERELRKEIEDYVVTPVLERYLLDFLEHYTYTRQQDTDAIGVWISGYVGAGKSHFAKLLGLLTSNPVIDGRPTVERFIPRIQACKHVRDLEGHLHEAANYIATEVIAFNINSVAIKGEQDDICSILYRQFMAYRGLSTDLRIATVEQNLIKENAYNAFRQKMADATGKSWEEVREDPFLYWRKIYAALCAALPHIFHSEAEAKEAIDKINPQPTFERLAKEIVAYVDGLDAARRDRRHRLMFIIDELGQFVGDSGPRILDVQSFAEEVAIYGKGKVWTVVTSHESIYDILKNARGFRGDIKKLEGRFHQRFTLTTENIEEVLEERLFKKTQQGEKELKGICVKNSGALQEIGSLEKTDRDLPPCSEERFVACYPFRPYQLTFLPPVLQSLRVAGGSGEALTGATRSLLGITQGILNDKEHDYLNAEAGRLVPFDDFFTQIEDMEIPSETRREINSVRERVKGQKFPLIRILRALYLIQHLSYIPRTLENLTRLLTTRVDENLAELRRQVKEGLDQLIQARYVAEAGGQYEYLSGERKQIENEIADEIVRTGHRRDALKTHFLTQQVLDVGQLRYEDTYRFDIRTTCDGQVIYSRGDLELRMISPLAAHLGDATVESLEAESVTTPNVVYWIAKSSAELENLLDRFVRMERIVGRYETDTEKSGDMADVVREKRRFIEQQLKPNIERAIRQGFREGHIIFRGSSRAVDSKTDPLNRIFATELSAIIPKVYTQFYKAKHRIADERKAIEAVLTVSGSKLAAVEKGLKVFDEKGELNRNALVVDEIFAFLDDQARQGNRVTGKDLCDRYEGIPYGWDRNLPRLVAAALFRTGLLSLIFEKKAYNDPRDTEAQKIFLDSYKFNRAELSLETDVELSVEERMQARSAVDQLFNEKPDETTAAIASVLQNKIQERLTIHEKLNIWVQATKFPAPQAFARAESGLGELLNLRRPNRCVRYFLERLSDIKEEVEVIDALEKFYDSPARSAFERLGDVLVMARFARDELDVGGDIATAVTEIEGIMAEREVVQKWPTIQAHIQKALGEIRQLYQSLHQERSSAFQEARARVAKALAEQGIPLEKQEKYLSRFSTCEKVINWSPESGYRCEVCRAGLDALYYGRLKAEELEAEILREIARESSTRRGKIKEIRRVSLRDLGIPRIIRTEADWERAKSTLDEAVRSELKKGNEVELT